MNFCGSRFLRAPALAVLLVLSFSEAGAVARFVPGDFATIQAAIDASSAGDVVTVAPGTYTENIILKSEVDVRGREAARTFIAPEEQGSPVVTANVVDDVTFGNFTIIDAAIAIDVVNSTAIQVANTIVDMAAQIGLRVDVDSEVDVVNCIFYENAIAIQRATVDAQVTNTGFIGNTVAITSPVGAFVDPGDSVDNCGFLDNDDLKDSGVDTGLGTDSVVGDPRFVDTAAGDFHIREGSPFIDTGIGNDSIDNTTADIGAFGGQFADVFPFPLPAPDVSDASGATPPPYSATLEWLPNLAYLVTNSANSGSYRVYYRQNQSGPPYDGTDAGNGTQPSPVEAGDATSITLTELQPSAPAPAAPQLLSTEPLNEAVRLSWSPVDDASGYRVHWGVSSVDENSADAGAVTTYTVAGLANGTTYIFSVSALRQPVYHFSLTALDSTQNRNESDYSPESTLAVGPPTEGAQSNQLTASPAVTVPYPDLPDKGCFVATAAFGADWAAEVLVLQDFRDRFLLTTSPGRALVDLYYRYGPVAAKLIADRDALRWLVRVLLSPLVAIVLILTSVSAGVVTMLGTLLALLVLSLGSRRRGAAGNSSGRRAT
ncbi:MAG: fibronectin type III domain-containing protein [Gammaproteobacteria bacterium]|nr:fibronectin type III domain-containing protein [Gammaproteobacteria bacterium]